MISIIIPAYNAAKTIVRCVESILSQTYYDWELIIIDDGSADNTIDVCKSFQDERIRVYHKENGGVSSARNYGLTYAKGEYIAFVDADDYLEPMYLEHLYQGCEFDLSITGFCYDKELEKSNLLLELVDKSSIAKLLSCLINADQLCYPWGRLFKRSVIEQNHIRFNEKMRFAEDNVFNWEYLCHINSLRIDSTQKDYHKSSDEEGSGYKLSFDEMDYIDGQLFALSKKIESYYGIRLRMHPKQMMHVLFLKDMLSLTATQWYEYYKRYHPYGSKSEGLDFIMGTVYYMSLVGIANEELFQYKRLKMKKLGAFLDSPVSLFIHSKLKTRFLIPFIKLHLYNLSALAIAKLIK